MTTSPSNKPPSRPSTAVSTLTAAAPRVQPPSWLAAWQPDQTPPATVDQIAADVDRLDAALAPTGPEALLVLSDRTLSLFPMPDNWEDQAQSWYAALADIPEDLIRVAFERVARNCRFWPRPAEVREQISVELMERRVAARRLKVALAKAKREVADEERWLRQGAAMNAPPVSERRPITVRVNKLTDLPDDSIEVSPADAAARVAEWEAALGRTA